MINNHKPTTEDNEEDNEDKSGSEYGEWKIQLVMEKFFFSIKNFEDTRTIYSASKPVEIFMGSDTENAIDTLFNTILNRIQQAIETSNERGSGFTHESVALLYYYFQKIDIRRGESYILSSSWSKERNNNKSKKSKR